MTRNPNRGELTPEESRFLDGVLPASQTRRLEHLIAADPHRAERLQQDRDAADVWRDDADRTAASIVDDPDVLADRVLALAAQGPSAKERRRRVMGRLGLAGDGGGLTDGTVMRYAAAAVMLMAIGVGGTWMVRANRARATTMTPEQLESPDVDDAVWNGIRDGLRRPVEVKPRAKEKNGKAPR